MRTTQNIHVSPPPTLAAYTKRTSFDLPSEQPMVDMLEQHLYQCAVEVEKDQALHKEMQAWNTTLQDGLYDETW